MSRSESAYSIRAVQRVCDIFELLEQHPGGVPLSMIVAATELPKSSAFRYMATLEARGYVQRSREGDGYRLARALMPLSSGQLKLFAEGARPWLQRLLNKFQETINLGALNGNRVTYLEIFEPQRSVRLAARSGDRDPIHSTALGKAIAAWLPENRVRAILAVEGMPRITERTITDPERYLDVLARVRHDGYALDDLENEADGRCVAVPVHGAPLPAAVSLSAPASRFALDQVDDVVRALTAAARRMSEALEMI